MKDIIIKSCAMRGRNPHNPSDRKSHSNGTFVQMLEIGNEIANAITSVQKDSYIMELPEELKGKKFRIRKLTPRECFRLMGVDDADIDKIQAAGISNSGQYKLAGNSIVVDVLFHLFRKMFVEPGQDITKGEPTQLTLF